MHHATGEDGAASGLRARKKRRTRNALATAALQLFAERGYEETTIADIAAAADVSPRTFFSYFPSKEDVVFAEIDDRLEEVAERLANRAPDEPPLETMRLGIADVIEAMVAGEGEYASIQVQLVLERPGLRARALQRLMDTQEEIENWLRELCPGIDEVDAVAAAGVAVGGMQAVIIHCRRHGYDPLSMTAALDRAMSVVEHGLGSVAELTARPCLEVGVRRERRSGACIVGAEEGVGPGLAVD